MGYEDYSACLVLVRYPVIYSIHCWIRDVSVLGIAMIKLDLTSEQLNSLLQTNFCKVDYADSDVINAGDTVQAGERLCHVTAVTDNPHCVTRAVYLRMGK